MPPLNTKEARERRKKRHEELSKKKYPKRKSFVEAQKDKKAKKAPTENEKKDLGATEKRESKHPIFKDKGKSIELKEKSKVKIKPKSKDKIAKEKSKNRLELMKERGEKNEKESFHT